jgi:hypothetical protein
MGGKKRQEKRHFSPIADTVGLYEPSRALNLANEKWPDSREGR